MSEQMENDETERQVGHRRQECTQNVGRETSWIMFTWKIWKEI